MRFLMLSTLAFVPSLAIVLKTPENVVVGQTFDLSWTPDPASLAFYLTKDGQPPLHPLAFASTSQGHVTSFKVPKVDFDFGYILAYGPDGRGPVAETQKFRIIKPRV